MPYRNILGKTTQTRKRSTPFRKSRFTRKRTTWGAKQTRSRVARMNFSPSRYALNKQISTVMSRMSETKYGAMTKYDEKLPAPIQLGALASQVSFVVGGIPTGWTGFSDLGGFNMTQGTAGFQRDGDYAYLKKGHITFEIDMRALVDSGSPPIEFRVIFYKARRGVYPSGVTKDPSKNLFLDETSNNFGWTTGGKNGTDLMRNPLNRRSFTILKDHKFTLSNYYPEAGYSGYYPCMKRFMFNLPFWKKVHFDGPTAATPSDIDFHYAITVIARSIDKDTTTDKHWEVNTRGNIQFTDN